MAKVRLQKTIRSIGSECQLYYDDNANTYIKLRYMDTHRKDVSRWYFKRVVVDDDGHLHMALGGITEENVIMARPKKGQSALDTMPESISLD